MFLYNHKFYTISIVTYAQNVLTLQAALDEATEPWGIKVERVEM